MTIAPLPPAFFLVAVLTVAAGAAPTADDPATRGVIAPPDRGVVDPHMPVVRPTAPVRTPVITPPAVTHRRERRGTRVEPR